MELNGYEIEGGFLNAESTEVLNAEGSEFFLNVKKMRFRGDA
jgi:hypothetical protein